MKRLKVYIQSPWRVTDSQYYKSLKQRPPKGIEYANAHKFNLIQTKSKLEFNNFLKQKIKFFIRKLLPSLPNAHLTKNQEQYDLIHCAHCLSKNKKPWVCDIEYVGQFWASGPWGKYPAKNRVRKYLNSEYCKAILAWSNWSKETILAEFPEQEDKVTVLYPAVPLGKRTKNKEKDKIELLFIGRDFKLKGGDIALEIFDYLTKKYSNVFATVVSSVPSEIKEKCFANKKIRVLDLISQRELYSKIYPKSDIFVYPTRSDTFGFAILEAKSFGIPTVVTETIATHTIRETVLENKEGFIVPADFYKWNRSSERQRIKNEMINKTERLIKNSMLLKKMSEECTNAVKQGRFSIKRRNKLLGRIYKEAIISKNYGRK